MGLCCSCYKLLFYTDAGASDTTQNVPRVVVNPQIIGRDVNLKAGTIVSGTGGAIVTVALEQEASFWELEVIDAGENGRCQIGVSRLLNERKLSQRLHDAESWTLDFSLQCDEAKVAFGSPNSDTVSRDKCEVPVDDHGFTAKKGDVIGVTFSQSEMPMLALYKNGKILENATVKKIKGVVFPVLYVSGGCIMQLKFSNDEFQFPLKNSKFIPIVKAIGLI